jgi:DNA-binding response OmpR family regulator
MTRQTKRFCDFGPFRLDRQRRSLTRGAETLPLPPKTYDVLLFLIAQTLGAGVSGVMAVARSLLPSGYQESR